MKTALIVGCKGQDGSIACDMLSQKGYRIIGIGNQDVNITDKDEVFNLLRSVGPDEIYYLAAFHHSSQDDIENEIDLLKKSFEVNVLGLGMFLEGIMHLGLAAKLFYASSSLIFGDTKFEVQDENTPFAPNTIYGISKLEGLQLCQYYRRRFGVFASVGILYNHESKYRKDNFISKKIIKAAINISQGKKDQLLLGDLDAEVDWGYAPDYVDAMHRILQLDRADDFIIASGAKHTVKEFVQIAFDLAHLDWKPHVQEAGGIITRKNKALIGNPQKLMQATAWKPTVDFKAMVNKLWEAELEICHE
jgi:GDPmannose 4,6-dehydratase